MNMDDAQIKRRIQELLFKAPLFAPKAISFAEGHALFAAPLVVDGWCPYCRRTSTFYRNRGGKNILQIRPLLEGREPLYFDLTCTREVKHHIMYSFRLGNNQIQKTAQYPPGVYDYKTVSWGSAALSYMRGALHKIAALFYFDEPQTKKTGQHSAAGIVDRKGTPERSVALGHVRSAAHNITSLFRFQEKPIRKKGHYSDSGRIADHKEDQTRHSVTFAKTKTLLDELFRTAAPQITAIRVELLVGLVLAGIGIFLIHENARQQTAFRPPTEETVQRAGAAATDRPNETETANLGIAMLEQRFDERFEILRKELELVNHSISHDDSLIAAVNARIDQEEATIKARLDQQKQESDASKLITADKTATTPKANKPRQDGAKNELLERDEASFNELIDQQEPELSAPGPITLDNTAATSPKADKPPNSSVPHLGIGVAKTSGLEKRGVVIVEVDPGSPAGKAGVRKHDLLLKVDGTEVSRPDQLREALRSLKGSHTVVLTLLREGKTQNNKVILR